MKNFILLLIVLSVAAACSKPKELLPDQYNNWVSLKENGFVKTKNVKNVSFYVRYLPAEYLAYKDFISQDNEVPYDSIWAAYKCGLTFQVVVSADKADPEHGNLMYYQAQSEEDIQARIRYLSFNIDDFITLKMGGKTVLPVLSNFEGFDQLGNRAGFQIAFIVPEYNCANPLEKFQDLTLVFDDPLWNLGTNNFKFDKDVFIEIPKLIP